MKLNDALAEAKDSIVQAQLPDEWQAEAFNLVLRHLLAGTPAVGSVASGPAYAPPPVVPAAAPLVTPPPAEDGPARLSAKVKVPEAALLDVFGFNEDGVALHVTSTKIASTKSKATQEVALLITAARQGSGLDEGWTSANHVREALQHYKKYDQSNFSANLKALKDAFNSRGNGPAMELRLTQPGWETAIEVVQRIAGVAA